MSGGRTREECALELTPSCLWGNGWAFERQSLMGEHCHMDAFS